MKNEAQFKYAFKQSVKAAKGFSLSLACPSISGIPDLYCILPSYVPILLEAKWLGEIDADKFSRKIKYSALQRNFLKEINKVGTNTAFGLIGFKDKGQYIAVLINHNYDHIDQNYVFEHSNVIYKPKFKSFDVSTLLTNAGVPKLNLPIHHVHGITDKPVCDLKGGLNID